MRQRVMIAMALACNPKLLIADEPTTALDVTIQAQILDLIRRLRDDLGMAIIFITHDLGVVAGLCDRVMVMYGGRVMEQAPRHTLYADPRHPYTLGLLRSVPRLDEVKKERLTPIPGMPPDLIHSPPGCPFYPRCTFREPRNRDEMPPLMEIAPGHQLACWVDIRTAQEHPIEDETALLVPAEHQRDDSLLEHDNETAKAPGTPRERQDSIGVGE
jgi:oligopeptide transport system ATP-binding protein